MTGTARQTLKISAKGRGETPARSVVAVRQHQIVIDEPVERHGTDEGAAPLELLAAALIGCTNVIASRIAAEMGIALELADIQVVLELDGRSLAGERVPAIFPRVQLSVSGRFDSTEEQLSELKRQLAIRCPVSALFRQAGAQVVENWSVDSRCRSQGAAEEIG